MVPGKCRRCWQRQGLLQDRIGLPASRFHSLDTFLLPEPCHFTPPSVPQFESETLLSVPLAAIATSSQFSPRT